MPFGRIARLVKASRSRDYRLAVLLAAAALAVRVVLETVAPGVAFGASGEGSLRVCFAQSGSMMARAMTRLREGIHSFYR